MTDNWPTVEFSNRVKFPPGFCSELREGDQIDHKFRGSWRFDPKNLNPCLSDRQKKNKTASCDYLKKYFCKQWVAGAQLLDFLLKNRNLIPEEWKGKTIFFLGSIYRDSRDIRCVRFLRWNGSSWYDDYRWLAESFGERDYILIIDTDKS